jgi:hypothetical protein
VGSAPPLGIQKSKRRNFDPATGACAPCGAYCTLGASEGASAAFGSGAGLSASELR